MSRDDVAHGLDGLAAERGNAVHALGQRAELGRVPTLDTRRKRLSRPFSTFVPRV
jgi:hypothetical protein